MEVKHQAVKEFAAWIAVNALPGRHRRGADHTITGYVGDLEIFASWFLETTNRDLSAETLTPDDIQDYIAYLQTVLKRKPNTVLRHFAAIRAYCLYLMQADGRIVSDLTTGIRLPKKDNATKQGLRRLDRLAVGRAFTVPWKDTETGRRRLIRDKAIVYTLMFVGVRVQELVNITLGDIVTLTKRSGEIRIQNGKGNAARTVGVPSKARQALLEWIALRRELGVAHDYLFTGVGKNTRPLAKRAVQNVVTATGKRAGLDGLSPHILRHTAVRIWRKETDDRTTAAQMGHSVATMQRYDALSVTDVLNVADNF
ncbi:MAG: tyrosine-type recombinase/integrase [Anaerolineales bacterium]|nr:tyrosine-type recombinase/integrase [Anaerolineales bacterium]